jgi:uncharacterized membrane protein SpoIIM required for sporulation
MRDPTLDHPTAGAPPSDSAEAEQRRLRALSEALDRLEREGAATLGAEGALRLVDDYRHAAADLAEARHRGWSRRRRETLEALVHRGHALLYRPPRRRPAALLRSAWRAPARSTRAAAPWILGAAGLLGLGAVAGFIGTWDRPELAIPLVGGLLGDELVVGLLDDPEARAALLSHGQGSGLGVRAVFAATLAANNLRVAWVAFVLGLAAGLPTVVAQTLNGAVLGSLAAVFARGGQSLEFAAWVLPHGGPEVFALCVAAGAGLRVGAAVLAPGARPRGEAVAEAGRAGAVLVGFATALLLYAASIEAFFRQSAVPDPVRWLLAVANLAALAAYLMGVGREEDGPLSR